VEEPSTFRFNAFGVASLVLVGVVAPVFILSIHQSTKLGYQGGGPGQWESWWLAGELEFLSRVDGVIPVSRMA
jgi:hypothetical protein